MAEVTDPLTSVAARLHGDIDRTRLELDRKLDALEDRLTPRELALDAWEVVQRRSRAGASRVVRAAQNYPLPAATILGGLGWLLYARRGRRSRNPGAAERLSALGSRIGEGAARTAAEVSRRAANAASALRENASRVADRVQSRRPAASRFRRMVNERPLGVALAAFAAGLVAGLALPATRREDEWMGESRDRLVGTAQAAGRQALDKGREAAEAAIEAAQSAVEPEPVTR